MVWNTPHGTALQVTSILVAIPSLLLSSAMIYFSGKAAMRATSSEPHKICNKIILCISISDFIFTIANILSTFQPLYEVSTLCKIEGVLRNWSFFPTLFFVAALSILSLIASSNKPFAQPHFICYMLAFTFAYCLTLTSLLWIFPGQVVFANGPIFCSISADSDHSSIPFQLFFRSLKEGITMSFAFCTTLISYGITVKRFRREVPAIFRFSLYKVFWYPFVVLLVSVPSAIDDYYQIFNNDSTEALLLMHLLLSHSVGALNAIVYGWQRNLFSFRRGNSSEFEALSPNEQSNSASVTQELLNAGRLV